MYTKHIPQESRKKILLLTDDIFATSGVAHVGREIITNTAHYYNWVQLAGAVIHPDVGKIKDASEEINKKANISDSYVKLYPVNGYGNPDILRQVMDIEKPDAILLITDPRYFMWVFQMENEIRKKIPIMYLNIWDDLPTPQYNREFYESCDLLMGISKQTKFINQNVLEGGDIPFIDIDKANLTDKDKFSRTPILLKYVPHGLDHKTFFPIKESTKEFEDFRSQVFRGKDYDFVLMFNSRNMRRKSIPDTILAWKLFIDKLPSDKAEKCFFILHTDPVDENGTDLFAVIDYFFGENYSNIAISSQKLPPEKINMLYNCADGVILLSSNEGWGLSLTEALLTGTPIIANSTGGMQDQMRFRNETGEWFTPSKEVPSNHRKTYKLHGEWAFPVFPSNLSLVGSVPTPYIFDDRCKPEDAAEQIMNLYSIGKEERQKRGEIGREWVCGEEAGFTSEHMALRFTEGVDNLFRIWEPRKRYEFLKDTDFKPRILNHKILY